MFRKVLLTTMCVFILSWVSPLQAEEEKAVKEKQPQLASSSTSQQTDNRAETKRYRLRADNKALESTETEKIPSFRWSALAQNSAALGEDPIIGPGSGKPYYDFRDGLKAPKRRFK